MINKTYASNFGWRVTALLAGSMLLTGCEYMDLTACQEDFAASRAGGSSCPALECACQEFLANGVVRSDGCYEYQHPVTGDVIVDCECRTEFVRGGGEDPGPRTLDPSLAGLDLATLAESAAPETVEPPLLVNAGRTPSALARVVLVEGPAIPECAGAVTGSRCASAECLCEWFLEHLDGECLTYPHAETGEEVVDCDCRLGSNPDDGGSGGQTPDQDSGSAQDPDLDDSDDEGVPPPTDDDQQDEDDEADDTDENGDNDEDDDADAARRPRSSFQRFRGRS